MKDLTDFTYISGSSLAELRDKIGDQNQETAVFTDTELNAILSLKASHSNQAAAEALRRLKLRPADLQKRFQASDTKDYRDWVQVLDQMITQYQAEGFIPTAEDSPTWKNVDTTKTLLGIINRRL